MIANKKPPVSVTKIGSLDAMKPSFRWLLFAVFSLLFIHSASAHYNPRLGRWLTRDPIGEEGGFNRYAYCGNDPVNRHDPVGLAELGGPGFLSDPSSSTGLSLAFQFVEPEYELQRYNSLRPFEIFSQSPVPKQIGLRTVGLSSNYPIGRTLFNKWKLESSPRDPVGPTLNSFISTQRGLLQAQISALEAEQSLQNLHAGLSLLPGGTAGLEMEKGNFLRGGLYVAGDTALTLTGIKLFKSAKTAGGMMLRSASLGAAGGAYSSLVDIGGRRLDAALAGQDYNSNFTADALEFLTRTGFGGGGGALFGRIASSSGGKFVPNPGGRLGDTVTRNTVTNVATDLENRGFTIIAKEVMFKKGPLAAKVRYADIVATNPVTGETVIVNVGKLTKTGIPIMRERRAFDDIIFSPTIQEFPNSRLLFIEKGALGLPIGF